MKKTIAALALIAASTQVSAMPRPYDPNEPKPVVIKACVRIFTGQDGSLSGGCDEAQNNITNEKELLANGCAEGQLALTFLDKSPIRACMPPGMVQL